jgi:hypothetical protein
LTLTASSSATSGDCILTQVRHQRGQK